MFHLFFIRNGFLFSHLIFHMLYFVVFYWGREPRPNPPRCKEIEKREKNQDINHRVNHKRVIFSYAQVFLFLKTKSTYEFNISSSGTNVTFLVDTIGWSTTISWPIGTSFAVTHAWHSTWTSTSRLFGTGSTFQCRWNDFRWQMQICTEIFNTFVFQIPDYWKMKSKSKSKFKLKLNVVFIRDFHPLQKKRLTNSNVSTQIVSVLNLLIVAIAWFWWRANLVLPILDVLVR